MHRLPILFSILCLTGLSVTAHTPRLEVDPSRDRHAISPWIYGTNAELRPDDGYQSRRLGGNRTTAWNWFTNASNAGADWKHSSDNLLSPSSEPGQVALDFRRRTLQLGIPFALITLPMAGYVAADENGPVQASETAPSRRWTPVWPDRETARAAGAPEGLPAVYTEDFLAFLTKTFGPAGSEQGIRGYCLDNEPALWNSTHPRMHPAQPTCEEVSGKGIATARVVKRLDPGALVFGPEAYGFGEYNDNGGAKDWSTLRMEAAREGKKYRWYLDWYLDRFRTASEDAGVRLLDVLSVHWYPEAKGGGVRIVTRDAKNTLLNRARMQAPRSLWDPGYREDSWIKDHAFWATPLIPLLKSSLDTWYPGTRLAFTEYNYGGDMHISGGIAEADVLGIFGRHDVFFASLWPNGGRSDYISAAFRLYRNADGKGLQFGDTSVWSGNSDPAQAAFHAATDPEGRLHLVLINKSENQDMTPDLTIEGLRKWKVTAARGFDSTGPGLKDTMAWVPVAEGHPEVKMPPLSVCHLVLEALD